MTENPDAHDQSSPPSASSEAHPEADEAKEVYAIYFYHVKITGGGALDVTAYHHCQYSPLNRQTLVLAVTEMARNARTKDFAWPPCGKGFNAIPRRRKGYFAVVLDDPAEKLAEDGAIAFYDGSGKPSRHNFSDAFNFEVDVGPPGSPGGRLSAVVCLNRMKSKKSDGDLAKGEAEDFQLELFYGSKKRRGPPYEDGGTNQGPPVPPPYR
jgi:hypothetical protein